MAEVRRVCRRPWTLPGTTQRARQSDRELFPGGKPSLEDFILGVAADLKEQE